MIKTNPESLHDEIVAGNELRAKHLDFSKEIRLQYQSRYFRSDIGPANPTVQNHAYEMLSILLSCTTFPNAR